MAVFLRPPPLRPQQSISQKNIPFLIEIIQVFIKHKILFIETVLSVYTHAHMSTSTHTHTHAHFSHGSTVMFDILALIVRAVMLVVCD